MREPYVRLYVHLVWTTLERAPMLNGELRKTVHACLHQECLKLRARPIAIGGTDDHVHILVWIPAALPVSTLVKQLKGSSSHLVNSCLGTEASFKWQGGYGALSVSDSLIPAVRSYIADQEEHHNQGTIRKKYEAVEQ